MLMGSKYDPFGPRLSPHENAAIDAWSDSHEQDAVLTTTDIEALVRILKQGTPDEVWNGQDYVPLKGHMLSVGEKSGKIDLGGPT